MEIFATICNSWHQFIDEIVEIGVQFITLSDILRGQKVIIDILNIIKIAKFANRQIILITWFILYAYICMHKE